MVEEAHLLTEEQIEQIKRQVHNEHSDQYSRILKRSSPFHETCGVHVEKFAKMDFDDDIEYSIEDGEFFSQEETNDDCSVGPRINLDQEVPIQNEDDNSKGKAPGIADVQFPGNTSSTVRSFSEGTFLNSKSNNLTWQSSTEDHFLVEKAPFYEEPNIVESCTESLCPKFSKKNRCPRNNEKRSKEEVVSGCVEAKVSITNPELRCGDPCLTADKPAGNSEPFEKEHVLIITNEDSTHDLLHESPNRSHEIHHHIACQYPPSAQRTFNDTDMCSCLRAIGEKDLITDVSSLSVQ